MVAGHAPPGQTLGARRIVDGAGRGEQVTETATTASSRLTCVARRLAAGVGLAELVRARVLAGTYPSDAAVYTCIRASGRTPVVSTATAPVTAYSPCALPSATSGARRLVVAVGGAAPVDAPAARGGGGGASARMRALAGAWEASSSATCGGGVGGEGRTAQESLTGGTRLKRGKVARPGTALGRRLERGDGDGRPCLRHRRVHLHPRLRTYACSFHRHCPRHRILAMRTPRCNLRSAQARGGGRRRGSGRCSSCQRGRRRSVSKDARACGRLGSVVVGRVRRRGGRGARRRRSRSPAAGA